ncbi:MAG: FIST C-terminal domain-containing protein [Pseudomonadota bacterium]
MHTLVRATDMADTAEALRELSGALAAERATPPRFLAVYTSTGHDAEAVREHFAATGVEAIHGGTSCLGVMAGGRMCSNDGRGMGFFALWDDAGAYGTGIALLGANPREASRRAVTRALEAAGRTGEAPDLVWLTAAPGAEESLIAGIEDVIGSNAPIIGGSAAANDLSGAWRVFDGEITMGAGVAVSVLFPSRSVATAYQSGYAPTDCTGTVSRVEGRSVRGIDGRPALEVYADWTKGAVAPDTNAGPEMILSASTFHPLGRHVGDIGDVPFYLLAHPATANPDGSIDLFADVELGEEVTLMTGSADSLVRRAGRVASLSAKRGGLTTAEIAGALVIFCGGCMLAVRNRMDEVAAEVDRALGGAPSLGIFTFGEQGAVLGESNRHGNLMISCVTFAR